MSSHEVQLLGKETVARLEDLMSTLNKIDSSSSVFFTYLTSYINSLCDTVLSRVELFNAAKDLYSIAGPGGNLWSPGAVRRFAIGEAELLSSDARIILALRGDVEKSQAEFQTLLEGLRDKFGKRHIKLKECVQILEARDNKHQTDAAKEKRRHKKIESKLKPVRVELKTQTDLLIWALEDLKLSYLDWMEPLINAVTQMRLRHPDHIVDEYLHDADLDTLRNEVSTAAERIHASFNRINSPEMMWQQLSQSLDSLLRLPFAAPYFEQFAEQEKVSEGFGFYQEVKAYQSSFSQDGTTVTGATPSNDSRVAHLRHILSLYIEEGSTQEINVPQSIKLHTIKLAKEGVASPNIFDKAMDAISEMLEESFSHFVISPLATQLQSRLARIQFHHARLQTTGHHIPQLTEASQDGNSTDGEGDGRSTGEISSGSPVAIRTTKRVRSGSQLNSQSSRSVMKRSSSSSILVKVAEPVSPVSKEPILKSASIANGKSNTAPLPSHSSTLRKNLVHAESSTSGGSRDVSPSSPHRGMRSIVASLTGILAQKPKKDKKRKHRRFLSTEMEDSDSDSESTIMNQAFQQASEMGPLATRQLCLLSAHFNELVNNPKGADFIIQCGPEKISFYCHSVVFNVRWPMLMRENMRVMNDIAKGVEASIHFPTVDPEIFGLALEYIYTGSFNVTNLTDRKLGLLTDFAKFRQVPGLREMANSQLLSRQPTSRIVASIASYVQSTSSSGEMLRLDSDTKYEAFMATLAARAHELVELPLFEFHQLHKLRRIDMIHLIRRDDFSVASEVQVFKLVTTWADKCSNDQDTLMENISFLVAHVRLPLMTIEELQWVESLGWVPANLIREALNFKETGICTHPSRAKPRKLIWSPTTHAFEGSSSSSMLRFDNLTPSLSSLMTRSTATSSHSLRVNMRSLDPLISEGTLDDSNDSDDALMSPASNASHASSTSHASSYEKESKKKLKLSTSPPIIRPLSQSPKSDSPLSPGAHSDSLVPERRPPLSPISDSHSFLGPSSPPLVRKDKKPKRNENHESPRPAPLKRAHSTAGSAPDLNRRHKKSSNKSKQDASPLTRAASPTKLGT